LVALHNAQLKALEHGLGSNLEHLCLPVVAMLVGLLRRPALRAALRAALLPLAAPAARASMVTLVTAAPRWH